MWRTSRPRPRQRPPGAARTRRSPCRALPPRPVDSRASGSGRRRPGRRRTIRRRASTSSRVTGCRPRRRWPGRGGGRRPGRHRPPRWRARRPGRCPPGPRPRWRRRRRARSPVVGRLHVGDSSPISTAIPVAADRYAASTRLWARRASSKPGTAVPPWRTAPHPVAVGRVGVEDEITPAETESGEVLLSHHGQIEAVGFRVGLLHEIAVLGGADDEVGRRLHGAAFEEDLEPAFLASAHAVEDGEDGPDDTRLVLDRHGGDVLHVVTEDGPAAGVDPHRRPEQPGDDVGAVDGMLEQRPSPACARSERQEL